MDAMLKQAHDAYVAAGRNTTEAARQLGIARSTLRDRIEKYNRQDTLEPATFKSDSNSIVYLADRTVTVDDAMAKAGYDLVDWEVVSSECTGYEMGAKLEDAEGRKFIAAAPLWRINVRVKPRSNSHFYKALRSLCDGVKPEFTPAKKDLLPRLRPHCMVMDFMDVHLGKGPGMEDIFLNAVKDLIEYTGAFNVERIILPVGNDFYHYDNLKNETTNGTQQDTSMLYEDMCRIGMQSVCNAIDWLQQVAHVEVVYVPGNHDRLSGWWLCQWLAAKFEGCPNVTVNLIDESDRKYVLYGKTLLGFCHGKTVKANNPKLPSLMMSEARQLWAQADYGEIHTGHLHKPDQWKYMQQAAAEGASITVRIIRSLSGTDRWHHQCGFVGQMRAAEAYLYDRETGFRGQFVAQARA